MGSQFEQWKNMSASMKKVFTDLRFLYGTLPWQVGALLPCWRQPVRRIRVQGNDRDPSRVKKCCLNLKQLGEIMTGLKRNCFPSIWGDYFRLDSGYLLVQNTPRATSKLLGGIAVQTQAAYCCQLDLLEKKEGNLKFGGYRCFMDWWGDHWTLMSSC